MPGVVFTLLFFPPLIAKLATLYLALADPLAALVGTLLRTRIPLGLSRVHGKSLLGSIAALLLCLALTFYVLGELPLSSRVLLSSVGAIAAATAELVVETPRPAGVDDNFVIPVFSAFTLSAAVSLLSVQLPVVHPL